MAPTYPINVLLYRRPCLVVGAGNVAVGKVRRLVDAGADVTVVAPRIHPEIAGDDRVTWMARPSWAAKAWFVSSKAREPCGASRTTRRVSATR